MLTGESGAWYLGLTWNPSSPPDGSAPNPVDVLSGTCLPNFESLRFRDPDSFVAGGLHENPGFLDNVWQVCYEDGRMVRDCLIKGVDLYYFFQLFRGSYRGRAFDSSSSPNGFCKCSHM